MLNDIVVSGMRPTGKMHLGHYLSVIKNWIKLQKEYKCFFFIADLHALTTNFNNIININYYTKIIIKEWLATGLNPKKSTIFIQSHIPETLELHALFSMITPITLLERVPTYKANKKNNINTYGFLGYPVLQGADIAILNAKYVPVGEDQIPHLEIIREIIRKINSNIKQINNKEIDIIQEPMPLLNNTGIILGTDGKKMSKSNNNTILVSDSSDVLLNKINKLITDSKRIKISIPGSPELCSVWNMHKFYSNKKNQIYIYNSCKSAKIGCSECKNILYDTVHKINNKIIKRIKIYDKKEKYLNDIISNGIQEARNTAQKVLKNIKENLKMN